MPTLKYWDIATGAYVPLQPGTPINNQAYPIVAASAPNAAAPPAPAPPEGLLWLDTSTTPAPPTTTPSGPAGGDLGGSYPNPTVTMNRPGPVTTGSGVQSFTDDLGDVWVAKVGVAGGAWRRARDVLHARYYLPANTALAAGGGTMSCTGVTLDPMGCASSGGFACPIPGTYLCAGQFNLSASPASNGGIQAIIMQNGAQASVGGGCIYTGSSPMWPATCVADELPCAAGDLLQLWAWINAAGSSAMGTTQRTTFSVQFVGPSS